MQNCVFPSTLPLEPDADWIKFQTLKHIETNGYADSLKEGAVSLPDGQFSSMVSGLVANLILVMQARPELVERGNRTGRNLKNGTPIHRPTLLGAKYRVIQKARTSEATGDHFTELGWRAGHMHKFYFGHDRSESRIQFVDPYIAFCKNLKRAAAAETA
jgi:hypothetical protein